MLLSRGPPPPSMPTPQGARPNSTRTQTHHSRRAGGTTMSTTNVIPDEFFSPLSYSLSVDSSRHYREAPTSARPPPPTQQHPPNQQKQQQQVVSASALNDPDNDQHHHPQPHVHPMTMRKPKSAQDPAQHVSGTPGGGNPLDTSGWSADWRRLILFSPDGSQTEPILGYSNEQNGAPGMPRAPPMQSSSNANHQIESSSLMNSFLQDADQDQEQNQEQDVQNTSMTSRGKRTLENQDVQELLSYIDGLGFTSPRLQKELHRLASTDIESMDENGTTEGRSRVTVPLNDSYRYTPSKGTSTVSHVPPVTSVKLPKQSNQSPTRSALSDRTNAISNVGGSKHLQTIRQKQPYPEMTPFKQQQQHSVASDYSKPPMRPDPPTASRSMHSRLPDQLTAHGDMINHADQSSVLLGTSYISNVSGAEFDNYMPAAIIPPSVAGWESPQVSNKDRYEPAIPTTDERTRRATPSRTPAPKRTDFAMTSPSPAPLTQASVKSPETIKQLLQQAVVTLQDAQLERESARHWAESLKDSVNEWAKEQRTMLAMERDQQERLRQKGGEDEKAMSQKQLKEQTQLIQSLEGSIQQLQLQVQEEYAYRHNSEVSLQKLLRSQQFQMQNLGSQLSSVEQLVVTATSTAGGTLGSSSRGSPGDPKHASVMARDDIPTHVAHTPAHQPIRQADPTTTVMAHKQAANHVMSSRQYQSHGRHAPSSVASVDASSTAPSQTNKHIDETQSQRERRRIKKKMEVTERGHVVHYSNGVQKEIHHDGTTVTRFVNGDVETKLPQSGSVAYFHASDKVLQITLPDQSVLYEYPNQQLERHLPNGDKVIAFSNGTKQLLKHGE